MVTEALDTAKVVAWLNEKWDGDKKCPISGDNSWSISKDILVSLPYSRGGLTLGGNQYPLVLVTCTECGYVMTFSAMIMGLVGQEEKSDG